MSSIFAIVAGAYALILVGAKVRSRYLSSSELARFVQHSWAVLSEAHVYRVATDEERKNEPSVNVDGMRELGAVATTIRGTIVVSRYVVDETRTIVATRKGAALFISSMAGNIRYSTYCLRAGLPCGSPETERQWFPLDASDHKMLSAHRARIAKAGQPLARISSIEHLAAIETEQSKRDADWRATQDPDELFEADLRSILRDAYARRGAAVRSKLRKQMPRATLRRV